MRLQGLKRISMCYAPLSSSGNSVAQFFRECTAAKALQTNPDCRVELKLLNKGQPSMQVEFNSGDKISVETKDKTSKQLKNIVEEKLHDIKTFDMLREEGYSLDRLKPEDIPDLEQAKKLAQPFAKKYYQGLRISDSKTSTLQTRG